MAAAVGLALQAMLLGVVFVKIVLPLLLVLATTIVCAALAGFRFLHWVRWVGIAVNLTAACYGLLVEGGEASQVPSTGKMGFLLLFLLNSVLFYKIPKRPDAEKSRKLIAWAHLGLYLCVAIPSLIFLLQTLVASPDGSRVMETLPLVGIGLLLYGLPFVLNGWATRNVCLTGKNRKLILGILISVAITAVIGVIAPVLAVPPALSLLLFLGLLEMLFLYPKEYPKNPWHKYIVMILGRLPQTTT